MQQWHYQLTIPPAFNQATIRTCLQAWLIPKRIQGQLRQTRRIYLNGVQTSIARVVHPGDQLALTFIASDFRTPTSSYLLDNHYQPTILYQTADLLVVDKPAGIKSHPNRPDENGSILNYLAPELAKTHQAPYMVHRLDQMTSGAMLVAKNPVVVPILDRLISEKIIHRKYLAWVRGHFTAAVGQLNAPIGHDPADKRKRWINTADAQPASTDYRVLTTTAHHSLVALTLHTGRTHQLRVHLAASGHPIIGDPLYDVAAGTAPRLLLHARQLDLQLPFSTTRVTVPAPLPPIFQQPQHIDQL